MSRRLSATNSIVGVAPNFGDRCRIHTPKALKSPSKDLTNGRAGYLTLDMSPGYGYSGIVIAMLAGLNPLGVVAAALFVAGVLVGADSMSRAIGVPTYLADVIVSVSLLAMLVAAMLARYRVRWS